MGIALARDAEHLAFLLESFFSTLFADINAKTLPFLPYNILDGVHLCN
jgi:hypothetical protein